MLIVFLYRFPEFWNAWKKQLAKHLFCSGGQNHAQDSR
jgi:hypothetical protein